jgi:hypothetical protein
MIIQEDYWTGTKCIENEVPWMVPDAIHCLDKICRSSDNVVEIGTGGSTLFFARRCKKVLSIETNEWWYSIVKKTIEDRNIQNVEYLFLDTQIAIENKLQSLHIDFDIASVDSVHGYNRSIFLNILLEKQKKLSTIVLDNYSCLALFPEHGDRAIEEVIAQCPKGIWAGKDFNDSRWTGDGTRIISQKLDCLT